MVTGRSGGFLVTGPSSVGAIVTAYLELKVNLFTSGCGEEGVWKLWPSMDPALPALSVCGIEHQLFSISLEAVGLWM